MTKLPKRAEHARDLRAFADELEKLPAVTHRGPEEPILARRDLVQRMRRRAIEVARLDEPTVHSVFGSDDTQTPAGRPVQVQRRRSGRILRAIAA